MPGMAAQRRIGLFFLLCGAAVFLLAGSGIARSRPLGMIDFKDLYYGTRCLEQHCDPYNTDGFRAYYIAQHGPTADEPHWMIVGTTRLNYLPQVFPLMTPFAAWSWPVAQLLWGACIATIFLAGSFLTWSLCVETAPALSGAILGFFLANNEITLGGGNAAGVAIGLTAIAVWCWVEDRMQGLGVLCLAIALCLKPHVVGPVWLLLLLSGRQGRERAVKSLLVVLVISAVALVWVSREAPQWFPELRATIASYEAPGGINSPSVMPPVGEIARSGGSTTAPGMTCDLRTIAALFTDDPHVYTLSVWLICAPMLALWIATTRRLPPTRRNMLLGLAAVVPLSMLPLYHRTTDAKLLLLVVPACAWLWHEGGKLGRVASWITAAAFVIAGDISLVVLSMAVGRVDLYHAAFSKCIQLGLLARPVPLFLLAAAIFYGWVYVRRTSGERRAI